VEGRWRRKRGRKGQKKLAAAGREGRREGGKVMICREERWDMNRRSKQAGREGGKAERRDGGRDVRDSHSSAVGCGGGEHAGF